MHMPLDKCFITDTKAAGMTVNSPERGQLDMSTPRSTERKPKRGVPTEDILQQDAIKEMLRTFPVQSAVVVLVE